MLLGVKMETISFVSLCVHTSTCIVLKFFRSAMLFAQYIL